MSKRSRIALFAAVLITAIAYVLWFSFPYRDTYLASPGAVVAFVILGGGHGGQYEWQGRLGSVGFYVVFTVVNFICYYLVSFLAARLLLRKSPS